MAEYEAFDDGGGGYYDNNQINSELYGQPKTSQYGQEIASRDWNSSPIDLNQYPTINQGFGGFLGVIHYETPEPHVLPYAPTYTGESPFDLQPYLDIPYPWADGS